MDLFQDLESSSLLQEDLNFNNLENQNLSIFSDLPFQIRFIS